MKKQVFLCILLICNCFINLQAANYEVVSPNGKLKMKLQVENGTKYEVWHGEKLLISPSGIGLNLEGGMVVGAGTVKGTETNSVNQKLDVLIGKNKTLDENYNELIIHYNENYDLVVRAYNEGLSYRFITNIAGEIVIVNEDAIFNFPSTPTIYYPECDNYVGYETDTKGVRHLIHEGYRNFERTYNIYNSPSEIVNGAFSVSPVLYSYPGTSYKVVVTEADNYDYPGLYMEQNGVNSMKGKWAKYPKSVMDPDARYNTDYWYSNHLVISREDYIVKTNGSRKFPWRVIVVSDDDKSLLNNELVYMLAEPCRIEDTSWIKPGKSAWEWWHKAMLEGVTFPVGNDNLGFPLYKYYIDWASENGIEYMTLDAGWSESYMKTLCLYANQKNVKIIVWTWASCVREYPNGDWIKNMKDIGISGVKIDFFERNDQVAMRWGYELAQRLADHQMVGVYHGCPVPAGLNRTYPNILNFEAVRGAEDNFWRSLVTPDYHTQFPFIRSLAGPEDYTPGSMRNKTKEEFKPVDQPNTVPMSMGTRAHELSMFVIFDHWLGYLCDAPTEYNKYPDILEFLSSVPSVWDKTIPLDAKLGEYILMAKQKGEDWYVGGMTNWDARDIQVDFSFLSPDVNYEAFILKDVSESGSQPTRYTSEKIVVTKDSKLKFSMAKGGGFVIRLVDKATSGIADREKENSVSLSTHIDKENSVLQVNSPSIIDNVWIYNLGGQCLLVDRTNKGANSKSIDISGLSKGVYIVKVMTGDGLVSAKIIN